MKKNIESVITVQIMKKDLEMRNARINVCETPFSNV